MEGRDLSDDFTRFIADVIAAYTPKHQPYEGGKELPGNWHQHVFGHRGPDLADNQARYVVFVANLFGIQIRAEPGKTTDRLWKVCPPEVQQHNYGVISLNYDMVIENGFKFLTTQYRLQGDLGFATTLDGVADPYVDTTRLSLAKIHGTLEPLSIVPPTWNKARRKGDFQKIWTLAERLIRHANEIRVLGYSLPSSDTYLKYLLIAAMSQVHNLKEIDVVCLDPTGEVRERYEGLFGFKNFRFHNVDTMEYLPGVRAGYVESSGKEAIRCTTLEKAHRDFLLKH